MSDEEQWEHDEQRAMETEIISLREQNKQLKAELKSIDGALDDPRANLTLTTSEIIWELKEQIEKQASALKLAREALGEVQDLIGESHGVYGLHLNGDESPWGELEQGGRFERLTSLNEALAAIDALKGE